MTITLKMPPQFVLEVVSPEQMNCQRDYVRKRAQYAAVGIPEYVIVDSEERTVSFRINISESANVAVMQPNCWERYRLEVEALGRGCHPDSLPRRKSSSLWRHNIEHRLVHNG